MREILNAGLEKPTLKASIWKQRFVGSVGSVGSDRTVTMIKCRTKKYFCYSTVCARVFFAAALFSRFPLVGFLLFRTSSFFQLLDKLLCESSFKTTVSASCEFSVKRWRCRWNINQVKSWKRHIFASVVATLSPK
jgi:hypothetical protein